MAPGPGTLARSSSEGVAVAAAGGGADVVGGEVGQGVGAGCAGVGVVGGGATGPRS